MEIGQLNSSGFYQRQTRTASGGAATGTPTSSTPDAPSAHSFSSVPAEQPNPYRQNGVSDQVWAAFTQATKGADPIVATSVESKLFQNAIAGEDGEWARFAGFLQQVSLPTQMSPSAIRDVIQTQNVKRIGNGQPVMTLAEEQTVITDIRIRLRKEDAILQQFKTILGDQAYVPLQAVA